MEEEYALRLVRDAAVWFGRSLYMWSLSGGVQDGLVSGTPPVPDTNDPVNGLVHLANLREQPLCVTLDLVPHLRNNRTLRVWRNLMNQLRTTGSQLIMIDHEAQLPDVVRTYVTPFEIALPDEKEIEALVRQRHRELLDRLIGRLKADGDWTIVAPARTDTL